jgi:hypothetical protein
LINSERALAALLRLGCYLPRRARGSHQPICRDIPEGRVTQVLVLGRNPMRRPTLESLVSGLGFTEEEFLEALGGSYGRRT